MKPLVVVRGPVATRSGYGNHARDLVTSLITADKYEIQVVSSPWGATPQDALESNNPSHQTIVASIAEHKITRQPDVFIHVSVPNEFQAIGKYNIGVTAGIETTNVSPACLQGANHMDLVLAASEHSKRGFVDTVYKWVNDQTQETLGELRLETPIEVLFEGVDLNVYRRVPHSGGPVNQVDLKDDFCYLFVGHWLKGGLGHDRKDVGMMIRTFCEAFKRTPADETPGLILKTCVATFSVMDRREIETRIGQLVAPYGSQAPNIYLLHDDFTDAQMNSLYNHPRVKAMVSFTKGEGFGRPLLEFGLTGKPIIASNWSGQVDFLNPDYCVMLPGELTEVHPSVTDLYILKGTRWFTVDYAYAARVLEDVVTHYAKYLEQSEKQTQHVKDHFSLARMQALLCEHVDKGLESVVGTLKKKSTSLL